LIPKLIEPKEILQPHVSWKILYLSYDFLGFLRSGLTVLELELEES
jgi:hypothetical protein